MIWNDLLVGFTSITWQMILMYAIGLLLIYLAIKKDYEPMLLLPIGFGAILVNLPLSVVTFNLADKQFDPFITQIAKDYPDAVRYFQENLHYVFDSAGQAFRQTPGFLQTLMDGGILNELFPILIFIAIGAMIDFTPLFKNPVMIFFGAAAQLGIFVTILIAIAFGFDLKTAASIGIIGAADGPTAIYVAAKFAKDFLGPITVAAYSYMALVPIIQPPVIRLLTSRKERLIRMDYKEVAVSRKTKIFFIISITIVAGIISPFSVPLVGSLMFGNLIRESGVLERLSKTAQNELANLVTILLGITIGSTMSAEKFLKKETLIIISLGLLAFIFDTAGGVLFAKFINLFRKEKINPMIGAAGISAFPMSARVVAKMCLKEDPENHILMHAVSANVAGQLGSIIAGGMILALVPFLVA